MDQNLTFYIEKAKQEIAKTECKIGNLEDIEYINEVEVTFALSEESHKVISISFDMNTQQVKSIHTYSKLKGNIEDLSIN